MSRKRDNNWHRIMLRFRPGDLRVIDRQLRAKRYPPSSREEVLRTIILRHFGLNDQADAQTQSADRVRAESGEKVAV